MTCTPGIVQDEIKPPGLGQSQCFTFNFSLLTFYVLPRRPHLPRVSPADPETLQPADHDAAGRGGRCARRAGSLPVRNAAARHQERADTLVPGGQRTYPLPDLPRRGHHPGDAVRQIHRPRQHLRRRTRVLYAMSRRNSRIARHNCWTSIVGGATTIGFGGSVGPEAPIVLTGAAIGSNIGRLARLNYKHTTCCCAAARAPPSRRSSKPRSRAWSSCWKS